MEQNIVPLFGVGLAVQLIVQQRDAVEENLFRRPVQRADAVCALEHDVFQIVRHAGIVGRVVLGTNVHADGAVNLGFFVKFAQHHVHPVGQRHLPDGHFL